MPDATKLVDQAHSYAAAGIYVHPLQWITDGHCSCSEAEACKHPGKHPKTEHGVKDAALDPEIIRMWWKQWPRANIGIDCERSGRVVVDVDPRNGGDESFGRLIERYGSDWTDTQWARSGGSGKHFYFEAVPGVNIPSTANVVIDGVEYPGIDIRACGGGIVAPPSRHASGKRYAWGSREYTPLQTTPEWLQPTSKRPKHQASGSDPDGTIYEGRRNDTLTSVAGGWWSTGITPSDLEERLRAHNAAYCEPPLEPAEVDAIAASIQRYERGTASGGQGSPSAASTFRMFTARELRERPRPEQLIFNILPAGGVAMLSGRPNVGKTFVVLDIANSVAIGREWGGSRVRKAPIVYVSAEGDGAFSGRVHAWEKAFGQLPDDAATFVLEPVPLLNEARFNEFLRELTRLPVTPGLVVLDTLSRCMGGADENSSQDASLAIERCDLIRRETGAAVLLVHHPGKSSDSLYRGSSVFEGALDTLIFAERHTSDTSVKLSCYKQKDMAKFKPLFFEREDFGPSCVMRQLDDEAVEQSLGSNDDKALAVLLAFPNGKASSGAWEKATGMPATTFHRSRNALTEAGHVGKEAGARGHYYATGTYGRAAGM